MTFTPAEADYLASQSLARFSTVSPDRQPDVVPVAFELDDTRIWIGGTGESFLRSRRVHSITAGCRKVALVVDDLVSFDPFIARGVRVYGTAEEPVERVGFVGPGWYIRITPTVSWSWNLDGLPAGDEWYPVARRRHNTSDKG